MTAHVLYHLKHTCDISHLAYTRNTGQVTTHLDLSIKKEEETKIKKKKKKKKKMLAISCYWVTDTSVMIRLFKSRVITSTQGETVLWTWNLTRICTYTLWHFTVNSAWIAAPVSNRTRLWVGLFCGLKKTCVSVSKEGTRYWCRFLFLFLKPPTPTPTHTPFLCSWHSQ